MKLSLKARAALAFTTALAVAAILLFYTFEGEITGFFRIGDVLPVSPFIEADSARIVEGEVGYDGQLFLTIALDPLLRNEASIAALDNPQYRYRRIGFPLAGYLLGFGCSAVIPYAMVLINILCIMAIAALCVLLVKQNEAPSKLQELLSLLVIAIPGIWITFCLTTSDLLATALLLTTLLFLKRGKAGFAACAMALACLTRETHVATAGVLVLFMFARYRKKESILLTLATLPAIAWLFFVNSSLPQGTSGTAENLGGPFMGLIRKVIALPAGGFGGKAIFEAGSFVLMIAAAALMMISIVRNRKKLDVLHIAAIPGLILLALSTGHILVYYANYLRVFMNLFILLAIAPDTRRMQYAKLALLLLCCGIVTAAYLGKYMLTA